MTVIKSVDIFTWAKILTLFAIVAGLVVGVLVAIMGTAIGAIFNMPGVTAFGLLSIIIFPIIFAILTFIGSAIMAFLYNIFASKIGGVEFELAEKKG
jgi:cell shape-determining protein MreD